MAIFNLLLDWLTVHQEVWVPLAVTGFWAWFCALTPTPDRKTTWGRIYGIIEIVAANIWRAKQTGGPKGLS